MKPPMLSFAALAPVVALTVATGCGGNKPDAPIAVKPGAVAPPVKPAVSNGQGEPAKSPAEATKADANPHHLHLGPAQVSGFEVNINGACDGNAGVEQIVWNWGDGTPEAISHFPAKHRYEKPGIFQVRVTTRDSLGNSSSVAIKVAVNAPSPLNPAEASRATAERILLGGGRLHIEANGTRREITDIASLPVSSGTGPLPYKVVRIDANEHAFRDADLEGLGELTDLVELWLHGQGVTDATAERVKRLKKLRDVSFENTNITDVGLAWICKSSMIRALQLGSTKLSDAGLVHLKELPELDTLHLSNTGITDKGFEQIASLSNLGSLGVGGTRLSDAGLAHLKRLSQLHELRLHNTAVTDAGMDHLGGLAGMTLLVLDNTKITDAGLAKLKSMTKLEGLGLEGTAISDAGLVHLKSLKNLKSLNLDNTKITDAGKTALLADLPKCKIGGRWYIH